MTRVAVVDCGTNTVRLLVADLDPRHGAAVELARESRIVRLGEGVDRTGRLSQAAMSRTWAVLEDYARLAREHGAAIARCCATSAARDAANVEEFLEGVRPRIGVRPEVLRGSEEAVLTFAGAVRGLGPVEEPVLVVDVGGGSTEVVLGTTDGGVAAGHSLDIGSVRLTERHLRSDPPTSGEVAAAGADVDRALARLPERGVDLCRARTVVAVSGTAVTLAAAVLEHDSVSRAVDGAVLTAAQVALVTDGLLGMTLSQRLALPYLPPGRADVIGAGALILSRVIAGTGAPSLRVSVRDILDGIAWSVVGSDRRSAAPL